MITKKHLIKIAKLEIEQWRLPAGLAMMILFCFIHRVTEGETIEETFFKPSKIQPDYEI